MLLVILVYYARNVLTHLFWQLIHQQGCPDEALRNRLCLVLGFWHPAKMCCEVLWRVYGGWFLAPAWHALFPEGRYTKKPRLVTMTIFFNYLRCSYPSWQHVLDEALSQEDLPEVRRAD